MFGGIGYQELLIIGMIALLMYGKRLPEVARGWGASYRDLRRSLNEMRHSIQMDAPLSTRRLGIRQAVEEAIDDRREPTTPRFVPPPAEEPAPIDTSSTGQCD